MVKSIIQCKCEKKEVQTRYTIITMCDLFKDK